MPGNGGHTSFPTYSFLLLSGRARPVYPPGSDRHVDAPSQLLAVGSRGLSRVLGRAPGSPPPPAPRPVHLLRQSHGATHGHSASAPNPGPPPATSGLRGFAVSRRAGLGSAAVRRRVFCLSHEERWAPVCPRTRFGGIPPCLCGRWWTRGPVQVLAAGEREQRRAVSQAPCDACFRSLGPGVRAEVGATCWCRAWGLEELPGVLSFPPATRRHSRLLVFSLTLVVVFSKTVATSRPGWCGSVD